MKYGYIKSELDGSEHIFKPSKSIELPSEYSYMKYLPRSLKSTEIALYVFLVLYYHMLILI